MQYNSEVVPVKKIEVDPSTFLSQEQPPNSPQELIEKADQLLSERNPLDHDIPIEISKKEEIPNENAKLVVEESPEPEAQSPKAVREYQIFENFEDPQFYNDKANFDRIIEDLNKQDKFLNMSVGSKKSMLEVAS